MSLRARATTGIGWTAGSKLAQQSFRFCLSIVLMRLLGPEEFGLGGMVLVFSGFAAIFEDLGLSSALVQRADLREEHRSTVFWVNLAMAGLLASILFLAAPAIAAFYGHPLLAPMAAWISLYFVLSAPSVVPRALLRRSLRFDVLAKVNIASALLSGATAVVTAVAGGGAWSLVAAQLVTAATGSVLLVAFGGWQPRLLWSYQALRELLGVSAGVTGVKVIDYWARAADKLLIGKLIGAEALGLYSRAYSLMLWPFTQLMNMLAAVMFPALSAMRGDKSRVRRAYLRFVELLTFMMFPLTLGFVAVAEPLVLGLLGAKWRVIVPMSQILALVATTQSVGSPTAWICTSQGRTHWMFWWTLGGSGVLVMSVVLGISLGGLEAVALAYLIGNLVITIPWLVVPGRLIGMSIGDVWQTVRGNLLCAAAMASVVWGIGRTLPPGMGPLTQLAVQVTTGVAIYAVLAYTFRRDMLRESLEIYRHFASRRMSAHATPSNGAATPPESERLFVIRRRSTARRS